MRSSRKAGGYFEIRKKGRSQTENAPSELAEILKASGNGIITATTLQEFRS